MDNEWQWQQENAKLQIENAQLKRKLAIYLVGIVTQENASRGKIFTKKQLRFIKDNGLDYDRVYGLVYKYQSVEDALIETLEGIL